MKKSKRLNIYKAIVFLFMAFLFIMPDSISALPEVDLRVLVTTLGVDRQEDDITVTAHLLIPETNGSKVKVAKGKGESIGVALKNMEISVGKMVELRQCSNIILGKKLAEKSVLPPLGYLLNSNEISSGVGLIFAEDSEKFIEQAMSFSDKSGTGLSSFALYSKEGIQMPTITLLDFLSSVYSPSKASYLPHIKLKEVESSEESGGGNQAESGTGAASEQGGKASKDTIIESLDGVAMIKEGKLVALLSGEQSKGITWLDKNSDWGLVNILDEEIKDDRACKCIMGNLKFKKVHVATRFVNKLPQITIKLKAHIEVKNKLHLESDMKSLGLTNEKIENIFLAHIKKQIGTTLLNVQMYQTDFLKFRKQFYRYKTKELRQFEEAFTEEDFLNKMTVVYDIKLKIT